MINDYKNKNFECLSDILKRVVDSFDVESLKKKSSPGEIAEEWKSLIQDPFKEHTRPARIRKGVLTVWVDSAAMMAELKTYGKKELMDTLKKRWPEIRDIKFKAGIV